MLLLLLLLAFRLSAPAWAGFPGPVSACPPEHAELLLPDRVEAPVRGLYHSIPAEDLDLPHVRTVTTAIAPERLIRATSYPREWQTTVVTPLAEPTPAQQNELRSARNVHRGFSADGRRIHFVTAKLTLPADYSRFVDVPGVVPLVPGRGVPLQTYVTLMQMRRAGVGYGQLVSAEAVNISSERTRQELARRPAIAAWLAKNHHGVPPDALIAQEFPHTHSYRYLSTILTQSGHQILGIEVHTATFIRGMAIAVPNFRLWLRLAPYEL